MIWSFKKKKMYFGFTTMKIELKFFFFFFFFSPTLYFLKFFVLIFVLEKK